MCPNILDFLYIFYGIFVETLTGLIDSISGHQRFLFNFCGDRDVQQDGPRDTRLIGWAELICRLLIYVGVPPGVECRC